MLLAWVLSTLYSITGDETGNHNRKGEKMKKTLTPTMEQELYSLVHTPAEKVQEKTARALSRRGLAEWTGDRWEATEKGSRLVILGEETGLITINLLGSLISLTLFGSFVISLFF